MNNIYDENIFIAISYNQDFDEIGYIYYKRKHSYENN